MGPELLHKGVQPFNTVDRWECHLLDFDDHSHNHNAMQCSPTMVNFLAQSGQRGILSLLDGFEDLFARFSWTWWLVDAEGGHNDGRWMKFSFAQPVLFLLSFPCQSPVLSWPLIISICWSPHYHCWKVILGGGQGIAVTTGIITNASATSVHWWWLWGECHWPWLISNLHTHHIIWYSSNWNDWPG